MTPAELAELRWLLRWDARRRQMRSTTCEGKHKYSSPQTARATIKHADMSAYRCRVCGFWHVGHTDRNVRLRNTIGRAHARITEEG